MHTNNYSSWWKTYKFLYILVSVRMFLHVNTVKKYFFFWKVNTVSCTNTIYWVFPLTNNFSTVSMYICIYSSLYIHTETHKSPQQSTKSPQQFYATTGITLDRLGSAIISPKEGSREGLANALSRQLEEMTPNILSSLNYVLAFGCWWSDNRE